MERIAITGIGCVTPLGNSPDLIHAARLAGKTGAKIIDAFDCSGMRSRTACPAEVAINQSGTQGRARLLVMNAAESALQDAGITTETPAEIPVIIGTCLGNADGFADIYRRIFTPPCPGPRPTSIPRNMPNMLAAQISIKHHLTGPNWVTGSACASSATAITSAARMIATGEYQQVMCGGVEAMLEPCAFSAWDRLGIMVPQNDAGTPATARPFDKQRNGFLLGEGAGIIIMESYTAALKRNARIYAELLGWGESSDAFNLVQPDPHGQAAAIRRAIEHSGITADEVAFIDAQATGTPIGDKTENDALLATLGKKLTTIPLNAAKAAFGHCIGAAAAIETIQAIHAFNEGVLPPHPAFQTPDETLNVSVPVGSPVNIRGRAFIKNSFGFGGSNVCLIIGKR